MNIKLETTNKVNYTLDQIIVLSDLNTVDQYLSEDERLLMQRQLELEKQLIHLRRGLKSCFLILPETQSFDDNSNKEYYRNQGFNAFQLVKNESIEELQLIGGSYLIDFIEGLLLSSYSFDKYKSKPTKPKPFLKSIEIIGVDKKQVKELKHLVQAVFKTRDLVNEPVIYLTAEQLGEEFHKMGQECGFSVDVFNKSKIKSLKMGGLLAINEGAPNPPTFSVLSYHPNNAVNKKPYVLIGKGVVFDTGGLTLKDTPNSMDIMKCDMAGGAAVAGAMFTIAKNELPFYIIGLVPATENRPDGNAITPGDVITMYNKKTVEILNTDAEGRVILADALAYADKFEPELIIDLATLTGSAIMVLGKEGSVCMGTADQSVFDQLIKAGEETQERLLRLPIWKEFEKEVESTIADYKNIGNGSAAGAITAGAFLKQFTKSPWVHLDIAGPAFIKSTDSYRGSQGTGMGVRLIYQFFKNMHLQKNNR